MTDRLALPAVQRSLESRMRKGGSSGTSPRHGDEARTLAWALSAAIATMHFRHIPRAQSREARRGWSGGWTT
jgi:hypothetical protein